MTSILTRWINYGMDIVLVLLISVWLYAPFDKHVIMSATMTMILGGLFFEFVLPRMQLTTGKILLMIPIIWVIGYFLGLEVFYFCLIGVIVTWRFTIHFRDDDLAQELAVLIATIIGSLAFFFLYQSNDQMINVLYLTMIQFGLFALLRVSRNIILHNNPQWIKRWSAYFLGSLFIGTGVIALFLPFIKSAVFFALKMMIAAISIVLYLPMKSFFFWIIGLIGPREFQEEFENINGDTGKPEELDKQALPADDPTAWFVDGLIILVILLLLWYSYKLYRNKFMAFNNATLVPAYESTKIENKYDRESFIQLTDIPPKHKIRKQLFKLEKKMGKYTFGRHTYEPVSEWLARVDVPENLRVEIVRVYQQVRYGEEEVSDQDAIAYRQAVSDLISWGKKKDRFIKRNS